MAPSAMASQLFARQVPPGLDLSAMANPKATHAPTFYATTIPFAVITVIFYIARMYSRLRPVNKLHWDDLFLTLGVIATFAVYLASLYGIASTGGHHIIYLSLPTLIRALRLTYFISVIINYPNVLVKISIAIMLLRIKTTKMWRIGLYTLIGSLILVGAVSTIVDLVMCRPISAFWSLTDRETHCWAADKLTIMPVITYSYFAATDFILAILPITFIRQLNRPMREKIVLGVLMGFGLFTGVAATVKTAYVKEFSASADYFYELSNLSIWTMLELFIGVIATCVPCLKVPADHLLRRLGFQLSTMHSGTNDHPTSRSRAGAYGGGTYVGSKSGAGTHVRMSTLASQGGPPGDPSDDDDTIGGGVWDGGRGVTGARVVAPADAKGRAEKGGIVKDTHFTWETSSAGS